MWLLLFQTSKTEVDTERTRQEVTQVKNIPMWDNLKIRQDRIGQDEDKMQKGDFLSCPSLPDSGKPEIGQDANSFVVVNVENSKNEYHNPVDVIECKSEKKRKK